MLHDQWATLKFHPPLPAVASLFREAHAPISTRASQLQQLHLTNSSSPLESNTLDAPFQMQLGTTPLSQVYASYLYQSSSLVLRSKTDIHIPSPPIFTITLHTQNSKFKTNPDVHHNVYHNVFIFSNIAAKIPIISCPLPNPMYQIPSVIS